MQRTQNNSRSIPPRSSGTGTTIFIAVLVLFVFGLILALMSQPSTTTIIAETCSPADSKALTLLTDDQQASLVDTWCAKPTWDTDTNTILSQTERATMRSNIVKNWCDPTFICTKDALDTISDADQAALKSKWCDTCPTANAVCTADALSAADQAAVKAKWCPTCPTANAVCTADALSAADQAAVKAKWCPTAASLCTVETIAGLPNQEQIVDTLSALPTFYNLKEYAETAYEGDILGVTEFFEDARKGLTQFNQVTLDLAADTSETIITPDTMYNTFLNHPSITSNSSSNISDSVLFKLARNARNVYINLIADNLEDYSSSPTTASADILYRLIVEYIDVFDNDAQDASMGDMLRLYINDSTADSRLVGLKNEYPAPV